MNINKIVNGTALTIALEGKLNATASQELSAELNQSLDGITDLVFDLEQLDYITSGGLRVLLSTQKRMNKQGSMKFRNIKPEVMKIFDMTGFSDAMTIE